MLIIAHLSLMIAALLCLTAGVGIAMFGRRKKNWLALHKRLNSTGGLILIAGGAAAFVNVVVSEGLHLAGLHQWFGLTAIILCSITWGLGIYSFKAKNKAAVRAIHRRSGRLAIIFMLAALVLGLNIMGVF